MPKFFRTWSFRLTLLYAGLFTVSVLALFGVIYWSALAYAARDEADENDVEFHAIVDEAELAGYAQLPRIIENHIRQRAAAPAAYTRSPEISTRYPRAWAHSPSSRG